MKQVFRDLLVLILLIFTIIFLWFNKGLLFAGGEGGIPFYDLDKTTELFSYAWQDTSAGYAQQTAINIVSYFNFLKVFYLLGWPGFLIQALSLLILMLIGTISVYFILREVVYKEFRDEKEINIFSKVPLIGSIFYLLNPFSMTQVWGRGLYVQFLSFALLPFFLLMFILGLKYKNFIFAVLAILESFFLAGAFGNPSYIISLWLIVFLYAIFYIFKQKNLKKFFFVVSLLLTLLIGWILIQLFWIYPLIATSNNQLSLALEFPETNLGTLRGVSKDYPLYSLIRLIHEGYFFNGHKFGESYFSFSFKVISWIIPIVALFSLGVFKKLKYFWYFVIFFIISFFICLGSNFPTGWLFEFIFKTFPFFQSFRNPFEKFGIVLTIAYTPFFALGVVVLSNKLSHVFKTNWLKILIPILILFLVCGVFIWPLWTGHFSGGLNVNNPWVQVPDYYRQLDDWLNQQKDDGRIIHLPINPGDGLKYSVWEHPYGGAEPGEYIFTRPSIGKNGGTIKPYYNVLLQRFNKFHEKLYGPDPDLTNSEFRSENLSEELAKLNVSYIILHKDIDSNSGDIGGFAPVVDYLTNQKNINKIISFGQLDVYKVDIPDEINLIYSPDTTITYSKVNPTLYKANVDTQKPISIFFLETFDPDWEAYIDGKKIENHSKVFSYANKWDIEKTGNFDVLIKYKPQDYVDQGMLISKVTIVAMLLILGINFLWKRKR